MFEDTKRILANLKLPESDLYDMPSSASTFSDGAHFRTEISTVNTIEAIQGALEKADELGVTVNRIAETYGIFRHRDEELKAMLKIM